MKTELRPAPPLQPPPMPPSDRPRDRRFRRRFVRLVIGLFGLFLLLQAIPYGHSHPNPPITAEPRWDSAATRSLAAGSCFDCHSNQTNWWWPSDIAPSSWLIYNDVMGGRSALNFSEWNRPQDGAGDAAEAIRGGSMPPWYYTLLHPNAKLSAAQKQQLIDGLARTFANSPPKGG